MNDIDRPGLQVPEMLNKIDAALSRDEAHKEDDATKNPSGVDRMSAAGRCYRERWFSLRGYKKDSGRGFSNNPRLLRIFRLGHIIEDEVISILEVAGYTVKDQQREVGGGGRSNKWLGHIDGMIDMGRGDVPGWCLLEIKSSNAARFELLKELGSYEAWSQAYAAQIHAYLHHLEGIEEAIVIVYCKDTSELYFERILFDLDQAFELERQSKLVTNDLDSTPPERPAEAQSQYCQFCKWCDFQQTCWSGAVDVEFAD